MSRIPGYEALVKAQSVFKYRYKREVQSGLKKTISDLAPIKSVSIDNTAKVITLLLYVIRISKLKNLKTE